MTIKPNTAMKTATPISIDRWVGPLAPRECSVIYDPSQTLMCCRRRSAPPLRRARRSSATARSLAGEEPGFLHQRLMALFLVLHPGTVVGPRHEGLIEGALVHQLLP